MSKPKQYYATFRGRVVELREFDRRLVRKFMMKADVVNAQVSGAGDDAYVAIVTKDGKSYLYKSDGRMIRKG